MLPRTVSDCNSVHSMISVNKAVMLDEFLVDVDSVLQQFHEY